MLVFVYGTLKRGFGNHRLLKTATYLGKAVTERPMRLAGFGVPFTWPSNHAEGLPLQGEVYDIGDPAFDREAAQRLAALDRLESNGRVYERKPHTVRMITNAQDIMPLPRDSGDVLEGVWIYEAMDHVQRDYGRDDDEEFDEREKSFLNTQTGALEWTR